MRYYLVYVFGKAEGHARAWVIEDLSMPYLVEAAHDPEVVGQDANLCTVAHLLVHHQSSLKHELRLSMWWCNKLASCLTPAHLSAKPAMAWALCSGQLAQILHSPNHTSMHSRVLSPVQQYHHLHA